VRGSSRVRGVWMAVGRVACVVISSKHVAPLFKTLQESSGGAGEFLRLGPTSKCLN
jgi:hypothetical protein